MTTKGRPTYSKIGRMLPSERDWIPYAVGTIQRVMTNSRQSEIIVEAVLDPIVDALVGSRWADDI